MKYYFYLDETGDHGLSFIDKNFPLFLLAGCLFDENELVKMETEIDSFKMEFFGTTEVILHSRDIRKCEGAFQVLFDIEKKKIFYERLNGIMEKRRFIIIGSGVDKEQHIKKYGKGARDPYVISLAFIIERLIFYLDKFDNNAMVDVRIEKRGKKEDQQLLDQYNMILDKGTYFVSPDRIKGKIESFESFYKKDNINGLQIADLCAYPLARHVLNSEEPYIPFEIIKSKIYCDNSGRRNGYGLKIFP